MAEKILVVDDDVESLKLIGMMLKRQGYEVVMANSGNQALMKAGIEKPQLVILDVMMADMDGYEVCRRLRGNPETRPIPIIMFTAKTLIDDKVAGFEAGADDYLTKPTHPAELASRIKAVLGRNATASQHIRPQGIAVGVLGSKGGIGTTTVAVNMAVALAQTKQRPIIADFQLGTGAAAAQLGMTGKLDGMATVLTRPIPDIRGPLVMQHLLQHTTGARLLASSADPKEAHTKYPLEAAVATVKALKGLSTHVMCDLGTGYTEMTAKLLNSLDKLVVLVEPIPVAMNAAEQLLGALRTDFTDKPIHLVVVNRSPLARYTITWTDVEARLGQSVAGMVSAAPEVAYQALETGQPIVVLQPNAVVSNQLIKLAQTVQN